MDDGPACRRRMTVAIFDAPAVIDADAERPPRPSALAKRPQFGGGAGWIAHAPPKDGRIC